jgi:excinuclease ABC subunit C
MQPRLSRKVKALPDKPGIYIFSDAANRALYVGKANSLRRRVATYTKGGLEPRLETMVSEARELDFLVTDSGAEALLLENNWIKRKRPRYNILLRDDKTYPYLKLTMKDSYPRIAFTRRIREDGSEYFGPYLPGGVARRAIKLVQKLFQVRVCNIQIDGKLPRPCLYHDMRRCLAPCVDGLTSHPAYTTAVAEARLFLQGKSEELLRGLRRAMKDSSEALEFEEAARLRDLIVEVESASQRRKLSSTRGEDVDIFGAEVRGSSAAVVSLVMRGGQVLDRREIFWEGQNEITTERLLSELLPQIYDRTTFIPKEIHLPVPVEGEEELSAWLSERKGERVYVRLPARGPKVQRIELANRNAKLAHRRRFRTGGSVQEGLEALKDLLELDGLPQRIEGFDISNFQGDKKVASMVVCEDGRMRKTEYRSFNIRGDQGTDDTASLKEAIFRRYRRRLDEVGEMPDLVLIDGGRGQLNAGLRALAELGVEETPVVALAKREEELYLVDRPEPLRLSRKDAGLQQLQRIRDEAHRFAITRHRSRRRRATLRSSLDSVAGIGPKRRRLLLTRFGSLAGVGQAELSELQEVLGVRLGKRLHEAMADRGSG